MYTHTTEVRVRYADTDQMSYVYNGKFFEYLEVGRTELLRDNGLTYKGLEEAGIMLPVREVHIKYKNPAFYDEVLTVETTVKDLPEVRLHLEHRVLSKERGVVILEGSLDLVFVSGETRKPVRAPQMFLDSLRVMMDAQARS